MTELRNDLAYFTPHKGHKSRKLYDRTKKNPCYIIWNGVKLYSGKDFQIYMNSNMWHFAIIDGYYVSIWWD